MTRCILLGRLCVALPGSSGCGRSGPSCIDEEGTVLTATGIVAAGAIETITVRSPKSSNLILRLRWDAGEPRLGLRATIVDCGGHTGCLMTTLNPGAGPGGPSPIPQPWPPGYVEMLVDGWEGTFPLSAVRPPSATAGPRPTATAASGC